MEGQENINATLWQELHQLRTQVIEQSAELQQLRSQPAGPATVPAHTTTTRPRPMHPDVKMFNGENAHDYLAFKINLRTKFIIDGNCYPDSAAKAYYTFSRLEGKASRRMLPWMGANEPTISYESFMETMDKAYLDADRQRRALVRINTIRQNNKDLDEFLDEFNEALLNAGGMDWTDDQKKSLLETAINLPLLQAMVGREQADSYDGYCNQLRRVNHDLQRIKRMTRARTSRNYQPPPARTTSDGPMDWEPTVAAVQQRPRATSDRPRTQHTATGRRAQFVSNSELQRRREEGTCLRCGSEGHLVRACDLLPPLRPRPTVAAAQMVDNAEEVLEESEN
jgi:hypothetical protein